jgi:hypothetical protein
VLAHILIETKNIDRSHVENGAVNGERVSSNNHHATALRNAMSLRPN